MAGIVRAFFVRAVVCLLSARREGKAQVASPIDHILSIPPIAPTMPVIRPLAPDRNAELNDVRKRRRITGTKPKRNRRNALMNHDSNDLSGHLGAKKRSQSLRLLAPSAGLVASVSSRERGCGVFFDVEPARKVKPPKQTHAPNYKPITSNSLQQVSLMEGQNKATLPGFFIFAALASQTASAWATGG
jgi:hypothetical protein